MTQETLNLNVTPVTSYGKRMPFVKLDAGILNSTIWVLRPDLEIFITALLMATPVEFERPVPTIKIRTLDPDDFEIPAGWYGLVEAAGPGIINRAHVDQEMGLEALERLASPEPASRSQEFEGRRMVRVNGGYVVLNFMRYRDKDHTAAERQRRLRERKRAITRDDNAVTRNITQSEDRGQRTDAETIYDLYPRKVGKQDALRAIRKALAVKTPSELQIAVKAYAEAVALWPASDQAQFVPYPSTWFNRGSYDDDRATWQRLPNSASNAPRIQKPMMR